MLSLRTILPNTLELLKKLAVQPELSGMRLVGGTSLALQYGHRQSVDLDFFGNLQSSQEELLQMARRISEVRVLHATPNILQLIMEGVKVDIVNYSCYSWIDEPIIENGITLASPKDIAALKINAIEGRGTKKDFIDVYMLLQHYTLSELLDFYSQKYPEHSVFRALLSLTYFDDAELQAMPKMYVKDSWETMKKNIENAVEEFQR